MQLIDETVISLWNEYEDFSCTGHLPYAGGSAEQPLISLEAIKYCKSLVDKITNDNLYMKYRSKKNKEQLREQEDEVTGETTKLSARDRMRRHGRRK